MSKEFSIRLSVSTKAIALLFVKLGHSTCVDVHRVAFIPHSRAKPLFRRHRSSIITSSTAGGGSSTLPPAFDLSTLPPSLDFVEDYPFAYRDDSEGVTEGVAENSQQRQGIQRPFLPSYDPKYESWGHVLGQTSAVGQAVEKRDTTLSKHKSRRIIASLATAIGSLVWCYRRVAMASMPSQRSLVGIALLAATIVLEVGATTCIKLAATGNGMWQLMVYVLYISSFTIFPMVVQRIPLAIAYSVWCGLGATLTAVVSCCFFGEVMNPQKVASIGLILLGVIGMSLGGGAH